MLVYVSGAYSGHTREDIDKNIRHARKVAIQLWELGHAVICPHLNTSHMEEDCRVDYDKYLTGDLDMISRCDAIVMLDNWAQSNGANAEYSYAASLDIPIYHEPNLPVLHPTEVKCPNQAQAFREIVGKMYRTHLEKNHDYSPANILATGEIGLLTRLWDKTARLLNLMGFRFAISEVGTFDQIKTPKNESVNDTYLDLAVYAIIGLILRDGKWGK